MTTRAKKPGTRKVTTVTETPIGEGENLGEDLNDLDVSLESVEDTEALTAVLEQFGIKENVVFRIYRQTPTGPSFCYQSTTFDESFLQKERGAGTYTVRIYINDRFKKSIPIQVDAAMATNGNGNGNYSPADSHSQFLEKLLMVLISNQATHQQTPGPTLTDLTQSLANIDALRGKQDSAMDIFMKGVDLAKSILETAGGGSGGDWKSELLKMGRDAIPAISSVVMARAGANGAAIPPNPNPPAVVEQPGNGAEMPVDLNQLTAEQKTAMLRNVLNYMKQQCMTGLPAESALDFIVYNSGNPEYQTIIKEILKLSFEDIVKIDAEIESKPFHAFFRTIYDGLRSEFGTDDSVENDPGGNPGDDANAGNDGDSGKNRKP